MAAPDDAIAEASRDPEVIDAAKGLLLDVMSEARRTLRQGDPASKQAVMRMYAGPIVKEVLNPQKAGEEDDAAALLEQFHATRRAAND